MIRFWRPASLRRLVSFMIFLFLKAKWQSMMVQLQMNAKNYSKSKMARTISQTAAKMPHAECSRTIREAEEISFIFDHKSKENIRVVPLLGFEIVDHFIDEAGLQKEAVKKTNKEEVEKVMMFEISPQLKHSFVHILSPFVDYIKWEKSSNLTISLKSRLNSQIPRMLLWLTFWLLWLLELGSVIPPATFSSKISVVDISVNMSTMRNYK